MSEAISSIIRMASDADSHEAIKVNRLIKGDMEWLSLSCGDQGFCIHDKTQCDQLIAALVYAKSLNGWD